jgi:hypothetical protein
MTRSVTVATIPESLVSIVETIASAALLRRKLEVKTGPEHRIGSLSRRIPAAGNAHTNQQTALKVQGSAIEP